MALLSNGFRDTLGAFQTYGATVSNNGYPSATVGNYHRTAAIRNIRAGQGIISDVVSIPSGNRHPNTWMMPQKAGALAARNNLTGSGALSASALAVRLALADLTGSGEISSAIGSLVVQLVADIVGSGGITDADIRAFLAAVADLTGSGEVSAAEATAFGELLAAIVGEGTTEGSVATGIGALSADILSYGELTPEGIRDAVWNAFLTNYPTSGTAGNTLSLAGSGGVDYALLAAAILAAAEVSPIASNIKKVNDLDVDGSGTEADPWGPV